MRWLYSLILTLLTPLIVAVLLLRSHGGKKALLRRLPERFGFIPLPVKSGGVLIHCVSVGEVVAAANLIKPILDRQPQLPITITTTTATGSARVQALFADRVQHGYLPFDLPGTMHRLLHRVQPQQVLITEVELWPNLIHACWQADIPVSVINARMTAKSRRSYQKIRWLFQPMLEKLTLVCAQGQRDFDNYLALGIAPSKLRLTNNIKFDLQSPDIQAEREQLLDKFNPGRRPLLLAGSTHDPEEKLLLEAFQQLRRNYPRLRLLLVPRHPHRFAQVADLLKKTELKWQRSSDKVQADDDMVLVDEMGVLAKLYGLADGCFVGGSIAERGGHNPLEAAIFGIPIMMGPQRHNNPEICRVLSEAGALVEVNSSDEISDQVQAWLAQPEQAKTLGLDGQKVVLENSGAVAKTLAALNL